MALPRVQELRQLAVAAGFAAVLALTFVRPAFADSDGYFCVGPGYLAYQFGMGAPPVRPHRLHIVPLSRDRVFEEPATIELPQFQVHGLLCDAGQVRVASFDALYSVALDESRRPTGVRVAHFEARGRIPLEFTGTSAPRNLGTGARLGQDLMLRVPLTTDQGREVALEVEPDRETIRTCSMELSSRIVERDGTGRALRSRLIFRGIVGRECGELSHLYLDRLVQPADPRQYEGIRNPADWRNPYFVVDADGIHVRVSGPEPGVRTVPASDVRHTLTSLPLGAWPYGRVVGIGQLTSAGAQPLQEKLTEVLEVLRTLDLVAFTIQRDPERRD